LMFLFLFSFFLFFFNFSLFSFLFSTVTMQSNFCGWRKYWKRKEFWWKRRVGEISSTGKSPIINSFFFFLVYGSYMYILLSQHDITLNPPLSPTLLHFSLLFLTHFLDG
jgi:hypothetical protein